MDVCMNIKHERLKNSGDSRAKQNLILVVVTVVVALVAATLS